MSRYFQVNGFTLHLLAPRYKEMLDLDTLARNTYAANPYPQNPTLAQAVEYAIARLPLWLTIIRSAYPQAGATDEEAETWLTDQGILLHDITNLGSGILTEYRYRLGFMVREKVQEHADFTPPSQDAPTTC